MFRKETFQNLKLVFLCLFWISVPLSISLSQILGGAALLFYLLTLFYERPYFPRLFLWAVFLYFWILIIGVAHSEISLLSLKQRVLKTEFGDIWMYLLIPAIASFSDQEKNKVKRWIFWGGILLVLCGTISLFSPYRLSTFVMDGFRYIEGKRLPHLIGHLPVLGTGIFLPIGFQNTHLTYGGLLALFLPFLFSKTYRLGKIYKRLGTKTKFSFFCFSSFSLLGFVLLFLNQSRSVLLGLFLSFFLYLYLNQKFKSLFSKKNLIRITIAGFIFLALVGILYQTNWLFQRSIDQLFAKQTLENQRIWIHKGNLNLLKKDLPWGIGAGNYPEEFENSYVNLVEEKPFLYYEISITPKSHAHHDFLHFLILGGVLGGIFYLIFWWEILLLQKTKRKNSLSFLGIYSIWIAGFFQCYLLDDEVLFPLICLVSLFISKKTNVQKQKFDLGLLLFLILPLILSLSFIFWGTTAKEENLFLHRTRDKNNFPSSLAQSTINGSPQRWNEKLSNSFYFKLEGCLNQIASLSGKNKPRETDFRFQINTNEQNLGEQSPTKYKIEIRERETFDQDKFFKAHGERILRIIEGNFHSGKNEFIIPNEKLNSSGDLFFIDYGIDYIWEEGSEKKEIPVLSISENCN